MKKKHIILITIITAVAVVGLLEISLGMVSALAFDQMNYHYHSQVTIPPSTSNGSYLGGYYDINGTGRSFNMLLVLSGAEDSESPLDYTSDGLHVTGHIDMIKVTLSTINYLLKNDFKGAMFSTIFNGNMNMTCAAWNGTSQFQNDGEQFNGTFIITGVYTDWQGNYTLTRDTEQNRIVLTADYIYYTKKNHDDPKNVHSEYYL